MKNVYASVFMRHKLKIVENKDDPKGNVDLTFEVQDTDLKFTATFGFDQRSKTYDPISGDGFLKKIDFKVINAYNKDVTHAAIRDLIRINERQHGLFSKPEDLDRLHWPQWRR